MHIADFRVGHLGANAIVGGNVPIATGAALGARYLRNEAICCCFAGDRAYANGVVLESLNFAAQAQFVNEISETHQFGLPIIFLIMNNHYGMTGRADNEVMGVTRLAQRGREAGIHLVASTQRPTASVIGGLVKANFPVRVVGSVSSAEEAKIASGMPRTGAQLLLGKGDFVVVARGESLRVQGPYVSPGEVKRIVAQLGEARRQSSAGWGERVKGLARRLAEAWPAAAGAAQQALLFSTKL